jgi:uncharacterized protein (UPF0248 family)
MIAIRELLSRIRWDPAFGNGFFEVGILDHLVNRIVRVPVGRLRFEAGNRFSFELEEESGEIVTIPFHRVREVFKDGVSIWRRPEP